MAKSKEAVKTKVCESCEEQDAVIKYGEHGWVCEDCKQSYEELNDDETQFDDKEFDDKEIDRIVSSEQTEDEEYFDDRELERQGFVLNDEDED